MFGNVLGDALAGQANHKDLQQPLQTKQNSDTYIPYVSPANLTMAENHGRAKKVYKYKGPDHSEEEERVVCPCCDLPVDGERIPLCTDLSGIYHLGSGYALYFRFLKFALVLLLLTFITGGIYNVLTNKNGASCKDTADIDYCLDNYITTYSIANKRNQPEELKLQLWFNLGAIMVIIVFFHYIRYELRKTDIEVDDNTVTPADYTVRVSHIKEYVQDDALKKWIEGFSTEETPIRVSKITRSYDIVEFAQYTTALDTLANKKCQTEDQDQLIVLEEEIKQNVKNLKDLKKKGMKFSPDAYVTFETAHMAVGIVQILKDNIKKHKKSSIFSAFRKVKANMLEGKTIGMVRAPEPSDILWANLGVPVRVKTARRIWTNILTGLMVILSFAMIVSVTFVQRWIVDQGKYSGNALLGEKSPLVEIIGFLSSLLIMIVNFYLGAYLRKLADYEKHGTYTSFFRGIAEKLSIAQLVNTAFTTIAAKTFVTMYEQYAGGPDAPTFFPYYSKGGLLESIFFVFISNAYCTPLLNIFDVFWAMKLWSRRKARSNPDDKKLNQKAAHALFEGTTYDMSYKYAMLLKTILFTCFFAPALPVTLLISFVGLGAVYWVDKYLLLRRAALPYALGSDLTNSMIEYLEWAGFMYAAGNAFFYYTLQDANGNLAFGDTSPFLVWAGLAISLANIVLPMGYLNEKLFHIEDEITENKTYGEVRVNFSTDYDIENPVTRKRGLAELRQAVEKNNELMRESIRAKDFGALFARKFAGGVTKKKDMRRGASFNKIFDGIVGGDDDTSDMSFGPLSTLIHDIHGEDPNSPLLKNFIPQGAQRSNNPQQFKFGNAAPIVTPFAALLGAKPVENSSQPDNAQQYNDNTHQQPNPNAYQQQPTGNVPQRSSYGNAYQAPDENAYQQPTIDNAPQTSYNNGYQPTDNNTYQQPTVGNVYQPPTQVPQNPAFPGFGGMHGGMLASMPGGMPGFNTFGAFNGTQSMFGQMPVLNPVAMMNNAQRVANNFPLFGGINPGAGAFSLFGNNNRPSTDEESGSNNS